MKKIKLFFEKLKFSVLFVPAAPTAKYKVITLSSVKFLIFFLAQFIIISIVIIFLFSYTPIARYIPQNETYILSEEQKQLKQLSAQVTYLISEIERLQKANERLKNAILLADSTAFLNYNEKKNDEKPLPFQGSVLSLFFEVFKNFDKGNDLPPFKSPVSAFITQGFDPQNGHFGIDYALKQGTPVFAPNNGFIVFSDYTTNDGYMMIIIHNENYLSIFKHCQTLLKKSREKVIQGEVIALSGNTGKHSFGPHLHFEIWKDGEAINPEKVLINN